MERCGDKEQSASWRKPSRRNPKGHRTLRVRAALRLLMDPFHWAPQGGEPVLCMQRRFKGCFSNVRQRQLPPGASPPAGGSRALPCAAIEAVAATRPFETPSNTTTLLF